MKRVLAALINLAFVIGSSPVLSGERPIVAVFDMEDRGSGVSKDVLEKLNDQLVVLLASGGYQVIPRDEIKERLSSQKIESYKLCYDKKCQIELGRELAAEKIVATQVSRFDELCTLSVVVFDLKKAATDAAATGRGSCDETGLLDSLDRAVNKLVVSAPSPTVIKKPEEIRTKEKNPEELEWVRSISAGIEFTKSEVTVLQYRACVNEGKCNEPSSKTKNEYCNWGHSGRDNHPINCVDWNQAKSFCAWAGGRLPSEEEWYAEASNRGKRKYPWGDVKVTCEYAVWGDRIGTDGCGHDSTWPVCSKPSGNSVSGLCDMSGNVWEWTFSSAGSSRVVRGGSWNYDEPVYLGAKNRFWFKTSSQHYSGGFRCGRSSQ